MAEQEDGGYADAWQIKMLISQYTIEDGADNKSDSSQAEPTDDHTYAEIKAVSSQPALVVGTIVVGKYPFPGPEAHDLPFMKGTELMIVSPSIDPNWYKAKRLEDGLEGMIPYNYVVEKKTWESLQSDQSTGILRRTVKLHSMPWFHGKITREESEVLLTPHKNGLFLVRESTAYKGDYTLCVCYENKVDHYRVVRDSRNWVTVDDEEYFENLVQLVEHYQEDADGLCSRLKSSVEKKGRFDYVVSLEDFKKNGWAIPRSELKILPKLQSGEFGDVCLGNYKGRKVTIKSLKEWENHQAIQQFLAEASIMTALQHTNLVSLIGVSLDDNPIHIITEFTAKGCLLDYLRSRGRAVITHANLLSFAKDVCKGMKYLQSKGFIHRDLAARNVYISGEDSAKISNFFLAEEGMSKIDIIKLPTRWTAPEALRDNLFSFQSDVWSFGVLLWEMYSYGRVPYPKVPVDDVLNHLEKGKRLESPNRCPSGVYKIMSQCWLDDPKQRPSFTDMITSSWD